MPSSNCPPGYTLKPHGREFFCTSISDPTLVWGGSLDVVEIKAGDDPQEKSGLTKALDDMAAQLGVSTSTLVIAGTLLIAALLGRR